MELRLPSCLWLTLLTIASLAKGEDVLVTVKQGVLRGTTATSVYNVSYTSFVGIPYATPPLGKLRFQAPQPAANWEGILNATEYGSDCVQESGTGSEDCLYLNVYVPGVPEEGAQLPVMFWIYGGGYRVGSGSGKMSSPEFLVSYGVIFVAFNYRLGPLGFLGTGDAVAPGNAGLKDQQLAMTWVQNNIASFGGDPQRVTIFGQSAGSMCTSVHFVSPLSSGLFSQAILESGTVITEHPLTIAEARNHSFGLGAALGYETNDSQQLIDFLQSVSAEDLVLVDDSLIMPHQPIIGLLWGPTIEPDLEGAVLSESYIQRLIDGRFNNVSVMAGTVSDESGDEIIRDSEAIASMNEDFVAAIGPLLHLPTVEQQTEAAKKLRDFYFGNDTISTDNPDPLVYFFDDLKWFDPNDGFIRTAAELSSKPIYSFVFDYRGENIHTSQWGVGHGGELSMIFYQKNQDYNFDPESEEEKVRRNMLRLWTNFAKYGNPTPEADPVIWEPYDQSSRSYLLMQANFTLAHDRLGERLGFWRENVPLLPFPDTQ
ncbi:cholinesterase-like isoform X1 [Schistocerca cancellata]|uniref:cholinesterase-like isoform X1 n=1 Tax=Schistocerca cancellata TaxID=274614 RepID=UPI0021184120|nr:cholinesterase-like isoform X1 [Schistocerca cancellata]